MDESTQQSQHIVGPQQMLVVNVLLLLKYLTKYKCRMRSVCAKCPKALSLVLTESPGQSCLLFFKAWSLFRSEESYGPSPQKDAHKQILHAISGTSWLAIPNPWLRNSAPSWSDLCT